METRLGEIVEGSVQIERSESAGVGSLVVSPRSDSQFEPVSLATSLLAAAAATMFAANLATVLAMAPVMAVVLLTSSLFALQRLSQLRHHLLPGRFAWWWISLVAGRAFLATLPAAGILAVLPLEVLFLLPAYRRSRDGMAIKGLSSDGMDLTGVRISHVEISDGEFNDANLEGAVIRNVLFVNCRFNRANLQHAKFENCEFRHCTFRRTDMAESVWSHCDLQGASLEWANLRGARLTKCDLRGADLENADVRNTGFGVSRLDRARLVNAEFNHETFWYVPDPQGQGAVDKSVELQVVKKKA